MTLRELGQEIAAFTADVWRLLDTIWNALLDADLSRLITTAVYVGALAVILWLLGKIMTPLTRRIDAWQDRGAAQAETLGVSPDALDPCYAALRPTLRDTQ